LFSIRSYPQDYLLWLHSRISSLGYCNPQTPVVQIREDRGRTRYLFRIKTWSYVTFNWIHSVFYDKIGDKWVKHVPECIESYLTPLARRTIYDCSR
jgi:hypothetical protein